MTLLFVSIQLLLPQDRKNLPKVRYMLLHIIAENQYIVEVNNNEAADKWFENMVHQAHECARCVGQTEWHYQPLI